LLQSQSTVAQKKTDQNTKVLFVLIQSHLLALSGVWEWGMHTDEILCSDVMLSVGEVNGIPSTRCLIHPEDLKDFTAKLQALDSNSNINFRFRIITTYGEVKIISCSGSIQKTEDALFMPGLQQQEINGYYHQKQIIAAYEQTQLELQAYRGAESLSQTGIWYINTSTHKMFYSDYIYKIHGFPPQSFNAHYNTFTPFIHPEDKAVVTESFDNAYRQKIPLHLSYRVITAAGEEKNVRQSTRWSFNDKGELILSGLMEDITLERKQEQELVTLKDQEIFHNNVLRFADEQKKMAGWYVHIFTRKVFYSKNIYRLYGMKGDGMALTPSILLNFVHPDDRSMVAESDRKILKEHLPPTIEFRIIRSDGKVRYLRQKGKTIINSQQEMMVIGITEDISDEVILTRKLNEERMNNLVEHALYRQAEQLGDMAAWAWDKQTNEITWSEGFSELLGYKPGALKLSQATLTKYVHPDDRKLFTEYINQILLDGIERNFQFGMLKKDKVQKINAHFSILEIESKTLFLASFRNVTSYDSLQQKLAAQERFKDMVSDATIERIFVTDLNNYLVEWNSRCEEAFNIKADKAIGNNIFDVLPEWKTPDMLLNFQHALNGDFITLKDLQEKRYNGIIATS
jgi:PAS domain S-box-containing protein